MTRANTSSVRALPAWIASLVGLLLAFSPTAQATSPPVTVQAAAANAAFLAYAPPPAGGAKALCLVDTGVNPTPDTSPGLVSAVALDDGTPADVDPLWHGTIDAAVAGGVGHGVVGAWPQLKVVSVRATDVPSPGQQPTFQYEDYVRGILRCTEPIAAADVAVIDLPLSSVIPPTSDQAAQFAAAVKQAQAAGISILAAAGNDPGAVQLPGSQPGVLPVGAGDHANAICPFSATVGLTFYAPGCGIDQINTRGETFCCGNGTSQASAFAAGVLVALRSYKPELTAADAVQRLLSTTHNGHLDVAAAFRAEGLNEIVDTGTAAIPVPPPLSAPTPAPGILPPPKALPTLSGPRVPRPSVKRVDWRRGVLQITLKTFPKNARLHAKVILGAEGLIPWHLASTTADPHTASSPHRAAPHSRRRLERYRQGQGDPSAQMMRPGLKALAIAAGAAAAACLAPSPALAGSYVVNACSPSASSGLWAATNTSSTGFQVGNLCGGPAIGPVDGSNQGALFAEDILNSPAHIPDGARAGWTFTAPSGTAITAISYYRHLAAYNNRNMVSGLFQADGGALEQCKLEIPLGSSNTCERINNQAAVTFTGLNTSSLFLGILCRIVTNAIACIAGGEPLNAVRAAMYSATVTLSEGSTPVVGDVGGALFGGGVVSGVVPVTFSASDPTGIQVQSVRSETGKAVVSVLHACDFMLAQPCAQQPSGSLSVDTARVPDGPHVFSLVVTDAAGNSEVVASPPVVVDNYGPPPPVALTATAKGANVIALAWRNPASSPAPVTAARVQLCQGVCSAAMTVSAGGAAQISAPGPGSYAVRLWLLDAQGRGGPNNAAVANVTVPPPAAAGARSRITAVLNGRRLRVRGTVASAGRVRVSWRSKVRGRTVGHGSRVVTIRDHRLAVTFTLDRRARRGTTRVVVRSGRRIVAHARARRG